MILKMSFLRPGDCYLDRVQFLFLLSITVLSLGTMGFDRAQAAKLSDHEQLISTETQDRAILKGRRHPIAPDAEFVSTNSDVVILYLHGYSSNENQWGTYIDFFNKLGLEQYTYNLRGHGIGAEKKHQGARSYLINYYEGGYGVGNMVRFDLPAIINDVYSRSGGKKIVIIGHSMGAMVSRAGLSLELIDFLDLRNKVAGLVALEGEPDFSHPDMALDGFSEITTPAIRWALDRLHGDTAIFHPKSVARSGQSIFTPINKFILPYLVDAIEASNIKSDGNAFTRNQLTQLQDAFSVTYVDTLRSFVNFYAKGFVQTIIEESNSLGMNLKNSLILGPSAVPTLYVGGELDDLVSFLAIQAAARRNQQAFLLLKNTGHLNILGERIAHNFLPIVLQFLRNEKLNPLIVFDPTVMPNNCRLQLE